MTNFTPYVNSLPSTSREDFPPLTRNKVPKRNLLEEISYKRYLVIKHNDENETTKMTSLNIFSIEKSLRSLLGKRSTYNVSPLRSGLLLIEVVREQDYKTLKKTKKLGDYPVSIMDHNSLNTSKGIIYCDSETIQKMKDEEILAEIADQNVSEVYRIKKRNPDFKKPNKPNNNLEFLPTNNLILTFNTTRLPNSIKLGYLIVDVKLYIPNPRRCFNCQRYGHNTDNCQHDRVCAKCGEPGHDYDHCDEETCCYHCHQNHATSFKQCPMLKLEKLIIEEKVRSDITFREARQKIYYSNPQLTAQIPRLSSSTSKNSYSSTSSPSVPLEIQKKIS